MNESIAFAEWLAENHFRLVNIDNGIYYWTSESNSDILLTTKSLHGIYKLENK